uniref:hypothetical protein n=1 Tax=Rhodaphanes brevistipitata TaxID=446136 RepID=UPI001FCE1B10|nr:hypothetical protein MW432_pgp044 [Rhodaphanes brevistipitata]UNJ18537.1 hypothetical protein [Rhodaphanes brevistipitata]
MVSLFSSKILDSIYQIPNEAVSEKLQVLLFSDGSLTRHSEIILGTEIEIELHNNTKSMYKQDEKILRGQIPNPRINRQIWLKTVQGVKIAYATSIWKKEIFYEVFLKKNIALGNYLIELEYDIYKEIYNIEYIYCYHLEKEFQREGPFWSRHYFLRHNGEILASIREVLSPSIYI